MPSVLIETAFLTNNEERKFLLSAKGQEEFAENIANAIVTYKKNGYEDKVQVYHQMI